MAWFSDNLNLSTEDESADGDLNTIIRLFSQSSHPDLDEVEQLLRVDDLEHHSQRYREMLGCVPVTVHSFREQFPGLQLDSALTNLTTFCLSYRRQDEHFQQRHDRKFGALALLLLTLTGIKESERSRLTGGGLPAEWEADSEQHDCEAICHQLFEDPAVQSAVDLVYKPDLRPVRNGDGNQPGLEMTKAPQAPDPRRHWQSMHLPTLHFHQHGTTSLIFHVDLVDNEAPAALKLILYPFVRISSIAESTRNYAVNYSLAGRSSSHVVRVHASTSSWILMDFVEGPTLAQLLAQKYKIFAARTSQDAGEPQLARAAAPGKKAELDNLHELGNALFEALAELQRLLAPKGENAGHGIVHADLTPSNIIVDRVGKDNYHFVLIDLGANHLYTRSITGLEGAESVFVAPEVRRASTYLGRVDLFSAGQLLIACTGMRPTTDGVVPDAMYARYPVLARLFEDLIDREPHQRLIVAGPECSDFGQLRALFNREVEAMKALRTHTPKSGDTALAIVLELCRPLAREPLGQFKLWSAMKRQRNEGGQPLEPRVTWLFLCSWLAAAISTAAIVIVFWWGLRDFDLVWGNRLVEILQHATGTPGTVPFLDQLRGPHYTVPSPANWPARIVAFTYALVGMKLYQNVYARMAPLAAGWHSGRLTLQAAASAAWMRSLPLVNAILVLAPTLVQSRLWPLATAAGQVTSWLGTWACVAFINLSLRRARQHGLSTVPRADDPLTGLKGYTAWVRSALFYAVTVCVIGTLLFLGVLQDDWLYACAVAAINLFLFYIIKCGLDAPDIRIVTHRAIFAAERLKHLNSPSGIRPLI